MENIPVIQLIGQLGVGGIFALLIIKEVLNFQSRKKNGNGRGINSSESKEIIKDLALIGQRLELNNSMTEKAVDNVGKTISEFKTDLKGSFVKIEDAMNRNVIANESVRSAIEAQTKRLEDSFLKPWKQ